MVVSIVAWLAAGLGAILVIRGLLNALPAQTVFGIAFGAYAMSLLVYAPLGFARAGHALTTSDRILGASAATVGGWAILSLTMAIHWSHKTGSPSWTSPEMTRRLTILGALAVASITALAVTLEWPGQPPMAPSTDFINDFGDRWNVVVYQLIFAVWIMVPCGMLTWMTWEYRRGPARWLTAAGCAVGVLWAVWKVIGTLARFFTGERIAIESPVSVASAATTVVLILTGLLFGLAGRVIAGVSARRGYSAARRADDDRHYGDDVESESAI